MAEFETGFVSRLLDSVLEDHILKRVNTPSPNAKPKKELKDFQVRTVDDLHRFYRLELSNMLMRIAPPARKPPKLDMVLPDPVALNLIVKDGRLRLAGNLAPRGFKQWERYYQLLVFATLLLWEERRGCLLRRCSGCGEFFLYEKDRISKSNRYWHPKPKTCYNDFVISQRDHEAHAKYERTRRALKKKLTARRGSR